MLDAVRSLVSWHGGRRSSLGRAIAKFSRLYLLAWNNARVEIDANGESWLLETVGKTIHSEGDCYFDVGANVGHWSQAVLKTCKNAKLFAFEPVPAVFAKLIPNVSAPNVSAHCIGLSDQNGERVIKFVPSNPELSSVETVDSKTPESGHNLVIECRTGDSFCDEHNIKNIRLLKVDTEGHDLRVLLGFEKMFARQAIDIVQFEHNYLSVYSRTLMKDFYEFFGNEYKIGRLLQNGVEFCPYTFENENFVQGNFVATRKELAGIFTGDWSRVRPLFSSV